MKKLMFAVAGVAAAGTSFGAWINQATPAVYDYKASMKHMYLKTVTVPEKYWDAGVLRRVRANRGELEVYQKYQKSASLKGYLIMDNCGATSQKIVTANGDGNSNPGSTFDYGRNRGFLVVVNAGAEKAVKTPKILPAVLDAKWIDTAFTKAHTAKSGIAEGTLFVGGDSVEAIRPTFDELSAVITDRGDNPKTLPATATPGMTAYADYQWTSVYLFGKYNGPNMFQYDSDGMGTMAGPFPSFEDAWDAEQPIDATTLQIGIAQWRPFFHDTWFNGAGIGKWQKDSTTTTTSKKLCCGLMNQKTKTVTWNAPELVSLSGNVKGGLFLCTDNGIAAWDEEYNFFDAWAGGRGGWDDQFVTGRLVGPLSDTYTWASTDKWQWDLWQDGAVEQETTDVMFGTWSIKLNTKFFATKGIFEVKGATYLAGLTNVTPGLTEDATGLADLMRTIYAAARQLDKNAWVWGDTDIPNMFIANPESEKSVPMVTPKFAKYYGLANFL